MVGAPACNFVDKAPGYLRAMGSSVQVRVAPAGADPRSAAHQLLLDLASTLVSHPTLTHDETGRPHVPDLAVSLSYSRHRIAVAASYDGPLGIDLEELHPRDYRPLANRWYTPQELAWMAGEPDQLRAFLRLWTAKEAVGKALGLGLHRSGLSRPMPLDGAAVEGLVVTYLPYDGAVLAIAAPTRSIATVSPHVT